MQFSVRVRETEPLPDPGPAPVNSYEVAYVMELRNRNYWSGIKFREFKRVIGQVRLDALKEWNQLGLSL